MKSARETVDYYITMFRDGCETDAFHGLAESDPDVVFEMISTYDRSTEDDLRHFLIGAISDFRRPSSLSFLKKELLSPDPSIWKRALDGLCMFETSESIQMIAEAVSEVSDTDKRDWIMEAIRDTTL